MIIFEHHRHHLLAYTSTKKEGNIAYHVPDTQANVERNRLNLATQLGYNPQSLRYMEQVHGDRVELITPSSPTQINQCDAMITQKLDTPLMVMVADCIPIALYDPTHHAIGVAHAGRNGSFANIAGKTVEAMRVAFGTDPSDLLVQLGASIHHCCYEVDELLATIMIKNFGAKYEQNRHLDLQALNKDQLIEAGVLASNIAIDTTCTKCDPKQEYFSYRVDKNAGRFATIMELR
jgi:YfiH family protein